MVGAYYKITKYYLPEPVQEEVSYQKGWLATTSSIREGVAK